MKSWPAGLLASSTRTEIMEIERPDGRIFRFTRHDVDLEVQDFLYRSGQGFDRSAIGSTTGLDSQDAQVRSFFSELGITEEDISVGAFDGSMLRIWATDFTDTSLVGEVFEGFLGEFVSSGNFEANSEILSFLHILEVEQGEFTQPECPVDLGEYRCTIPLDPPVVCRSTPYTLGQFVKVPTALVRILFPLELENAGFEDAGMSPWVTLRGDPVATTLEAGLFPFEGSRFLRGTLISPRGFSIRRIDEIAPAAIAGGELDVGDVDDFLNAIDNGEASVEASIRRANGGGDVRDSGAVFIEALDEDGGSLGKLWDYEASSGPRMGKRAFDIISPPFAWQIRTCAGRVLPPLTRQLAITITGVTRSGSKCNASFDDLQVTIVLHGSVYRQAAYENRIYEVTTAGTTDPTAPTFNTTEDATTTDGTVVFTAREAWTRHAIVAAITSPTIIEVTVDEDRAAVDGWFENGIVKAQTGDNANAPGMRIQSWDGSDQEFTLFVPFPFDLEVGDELILVKGCRKRAIDCNEFAFDLVAQPEGNIKNFQGFPTSPLIDQITRAPMILVRT